MKRKLFSVLMAAVITATLVSAFTVSAFAQETAQLEEIDYDLGVGMLDTPDIPDNYKDDAEHPGTVTTVTYDNGIGEKFFNIYLPYGYEDSTDSYNVLYIVHGNGGDPTNYLKADKDTAIKKMLDHMIEDGLCEPFIMAAVSWRPTNEEGFEDDPEGKIDYTVYFAQEELPNVIIPYVDANYRTNADRDHRAFAGFSRGGVTTWNVIMYDMKDFATFLPFSGHCMIDGVEGFDATVAAMADAIAAEGMTADDFAIYCATGSLDTALPNLVPQMKAMQENEMFKFGENTFFGVKEGIVHGDPNSKYYLYAILPIMW